MSACIPLKAEPETEACVQVVKSVTQGAGAKDGEGGKASTRV